MKIKTIISHQIPGIKLIEFERYIDNRGFFTETYRTADFINNELKVFPNGIMQSNESYSCKNVLRGLHFQWNPNMGKLVRTIAGHMVDLVLDLRKGSPTQGKIMAFDMPANSTHDSSSWIWIPEGCAHGNYFLDNTYIEYFCSGSYNGDCEAGISPFAEDIDWTICDPKLKDQFFNLKDKFIATPKDINGLSFNDWLSRKEAQNFTI